MPLCGEVALPDQHLQHPRLPFQHPRILRPVRPFPVGADRRGRIRKCQRKSFFGFIGVQPLGYGERFRLAKIVIVILDKNRLPLPSLNPVDITVRPHGIGPDDQPGLFQSFPDKRGLPALARFYASARKFVLVIYGTVHHGHAVFADEDTPHRRPHICQAMRIVVFGVHLKKQSHESPPKCAYRLVECGGRPNRYAVPPPDPAADENSPEKFKNPCLMYGDRGFFILDR